MRTQTIEKTNAIENAPITDINSKFLGFTDLLTLAKSLSHSQGFYTRLYNNLQELDTEQKQKLNNTIKKQRFTTSLDLILWIEG